MQGSQYEHFKSYKYNAIWKIIATMDTNILEQLFGETQILNLSR